jgi:hypothetical protein
LAIKLQQAFPGRVILDIAAIETETPPARRVFFEVLTIEGIESLAGGVIRYVLAVNRVEALPCLVRLEMGAVERIMILS